MFASLPETGQSSYKCRLDWNTFDIYKGVPPSSSVSSTSPPASKSSLHSEVEPLAAAANKDIALSLWAEVWKYLKVKEKDIFDLSTAGLLPQITVFPHSLQKI